MQKLHLKSKISSFVIAFINAIFMATMSIFLIGKECNALVLAIIVVIFSALQLVAHYLSRNIFKGSKAYVTILFGILLLLGIAYSVNNTPAETICISWALLDLVLIVFNVIGLIIELKHNKLSIVELIVQGLNVIIDILLLIELEEGLPLHLAFCSFEIIVSTVVAIIELREQKKHFSSPMLSANKNLK